MQKKLDIRVKLTPKKKTEWPNFRLRIAAETQKSRAIFKADCNLKTVMVESRWAVANGGQVKLMFRKVLLRIWSDLKGIIYYVLLTYNQTSNSYVYFNNCTV